MLSARELTYAYAAIPVLQDVSLDIGAGERVALLGPSGSGKSTLLYCLAGIVVPSRGEVTLAGQTLSGLSSDERAKRRLGSFGFVFQFAELVPELTLRENVELPLRLLGVQRSQYRSRARELLDRLGIDDVADRPAREVSGGQAQRCAIARAVAHRPQVLFADEPTGALDTASATVALRELLDAAADVEATLVVVTHDAAVARQLDRTVTLLDGRVVAGCDELV